LQGFMDKQANTTTRFVATRNYLKYVCFWNS